MQHINLNPQIINRLENDFNMVARGSHLRGGECPDCGKKTLWTWVEKPGRVQCDRTNNCNFSATSKELFPDLFERINERYKPTAENPNATADAYLSLIRGIDPSAVKGWYDQNKYWHPNGNKGTASVRFYLTADKQTYWERLIDTVTITDDDGSTEERNKSFKGAFKGLWWQPPQLTINKDDTVYFCEGILDAISLNLNGLKAVAIMSSGTFPHDAIKPHLGQNVEWVLALDNDKTGRRFTKKHGQTLRDMGERVTAMLSSESDEKSDWNDLHRAKKLTEQDINQYRYLGGLELAISYREKAQMIWQHKNCRQYVYDYRNKTYSLKIDKKKHDDAIKTFVYGQAGAADESLNSGDVEKIIAELSDEQKKELYSSAFGASATIQEIATFKMDYLYFQQPDNGEDGQYFFHFTLATNHQSREIAFSHKTMNAASDFSKSSMRIPGACFDGSTANLRWLYKDWTRRNQKEVRTLDYIGYDKKTRAYIYNDFAIEKGRIHKVNSQSFFQLKKEGIKTTVDIRQTLSTKKNTAWLKDYKTAFKTKGLIALGWWFGSLFAEQIREQHRAYPYFELVGTPDSGKSLLVDFLWKLYGKEGETFNPKVSTAAGRIRKMSEVSNIPIVFNETDNEAQDGARHEKKFAWDELKDLFEGHFGKVTGVKSMDNRTRKTLFKAALMMLQNVKIVASEAMMTRMVHMFFDTSHHSPAGYDASVRLNALDVKELNGFLINTVKQEELILKRFNQQYPKHRVSLIANKEIKTNRIIDNHAKIMALFDCLKGVIPDISDQDVVDVRIMLEEMAVECQQGLNEDSQLVQQFWGQYYYMNSEPEIGYQRQVGDQKPRLNHSRTPEQTICISLEHFHRMCTVLGQPKMEPNELRRQLKDSKKHKFIHCKVINSAIEPRSVRCFVFEVKGV